MSSGDHQTCAYRCAHGMRCTSGCHRVEALVSHQVASASKIRADGSDNLAHPVYGDERDASIIKRIRDALMQMIRILLGSMHFFNVDPVAELVQGILVARTLRDSDRRYGATGFS